MFDPEQSIADWRQQMLAAGIQNPVPLEELENHLRDEVERQLHSGTSNQRAFEIAVQQIGKAGALNQEFEKTESTVMKQIAKIGAGIIGVLVGMAFIMPAAAQCRHEGVMTKDEVVLYTFGMAICFAGAWLALHSLNKRKA
jgi:hypothetical protein